MKSTCKSNHIGPFLVLSGQFQCCLNCIGTCRSTAHNFIIQLSRTEDQSLEFSQKFLFGTGIHIQCIDNIVIRQIIQNGFFNLRIVVTVIHGTGYSQEINISLTVFRKHFSIQSFLKNDRVLSAIGSDNRFSLFKNIHILSHSMPHRSGILFLSVYSLCIASSFRFSFQHTLNNYHIVLFF